MSETTKQPEVQFEESRLPKEETLKNFMIEFFDFDLMRKAKIYGRGIKRKDYQAQADIICKMFGYSTIFEYGKDDIRCHLTFSEGNRPPEEPFVTIIPNIYEQ